MAPPGILSIDEHLDTLRATRKNISDPAFSHLSKSWSASLARGVSKSIIHDHDYVLQQQLFCESSTDSNSFEELDIASIDFDDFVSKTVTEVGDATGADDSSYGNKPIAASKYGVDNSKCQPIGANDAHLTENTDSSDIPTCWFMDDADDDFLDGLDNFDLELDEFDPCIDMDTEDSFQNFIEETLNSPTTNACIDEKYELLSLTDEEEDIHKKEYFLKLLGLQSVSRTTQNRLSLPGDCVNTNTKCQPTFVQGHSPDVGVDFLCKGNIHCVSSSAITANPSSTPASVPAKMCSCAAADWKDSLLYSTAPACSNGFVQTNLSTAPTKSIVYNTAAQNFRFSSNDTGIMHSSPVKSLHNCEGLKSGSLLSVDGLQFKNHSDADAFLRWLEEGRVTMSSRQATAKISKTNEGSSFKKNTSVQLSVDQAGTNRAPESNHLSAGHSISDMDTFIDLETYAMEKSPSSVQFGKDTHPSNYLSNHARDAKIDLEEKLGFIESKYPPSSELRFRLSLLDGLSCRNDRYLEKRDTSCPFGVSSDDVNSLCKDLTFGDPLTDLTSDAASSPLSPFSSSSSSVHSSYGQHKGGEDSLDLLGLFSEENSFLLMEQSDSRYGFC